MHPSNLSYFFIIATSTLCSPSFVSADDARYENCTTTFQCGNITDISYPFWGSKLPSYCGHPKFWLNCTDDQAAVITINNLTYKVLDMDTESQNLKVARTDYIGDICPKLLVNTTLDPTFFQLATDVQNITLFYGCPRSQIQFPSLNSNQFTCNLNGSESDGFYLPWSDSGSNAFVSLLLRCNNNVVVKATQSAIQPIILTPSRQNLAIALEQGFGLHWTFENDSFCQTCRASGGRCGYNSTTSSFACFCSDKLYRFTCGDANQPGSAAGGISQPTRIGIAAAASITASILLGCYCWYCFVKRRRRPLSGKTKREEKLETFILSYQSLMPKRYSYSDIKKMTNSFTNKLGQGGFGGVYRGKLPDGCVVAVKVINNSIGDGEEFINEVASISRTSHVNIVSLLGFCYERSKKALIYEYMPNGSLDNFICGSESQHKEGRQLEQKTLCDIAVGIARGLEYLHRGCNTKIVHFDIKPQNVLLDKDFCPKISDFGLAKLCKGRESILSTLGARGTAGYIAPEVFMRSFGGASYKSDVYSYGMMILEMFGGRKNNDVGLSRSSETYFPDSIYKQLESGQNLVTGENITNEEQEVARRMMIVGLWCIQTNPLDRPTTTNVVEMLQGSLQSLQIPPKPSLFSATAPPQYSNVLSSTTCSRSERDEETALSLGETELAADLKL